MKRKKSFINKVLLFLSKQYYLYFILAVLISVIMVQFAYKTQDLEVTDVIELSTFSAVVLESFLRGITGFIRKLVSNKIEDPSKLTTEYNELTKTYNASKSKMIIGSENTLFPVVFESWLFDKTIAVEDSPEYEYRLPEMVIKYYDKLFSAHDTSNIYNNVNIRVNDWCLNGDLFTIKTGRTSYYNSLVTNRALDYEIEKGITVRQLYECGPFVHPLSMSVLSNHIGFNGFIESSDCYIGFIYRGKDVSIGKATWATSIGASLKAKYALDQHFTFSVERLYKGILSEIEDELKIKNSKLLKIGTQFKKVVIISAYRDLIEGGKPQLLFYAKCGLPKEKITKLFNNSNSNVKKRANKVINIRERKEIQMETDGKIIKWISVEDIMNSISVYPDRIIHDGKELTMMPSASASVQMLKEYLLKIREGCNNDNS